MSKGNPIVKVRFDKATLAQMEAAQRSAFETTKDGPPDLSEWIRRAVRDKLKHLARSKKRQARTDQDVNVTPSVEAEGPELVE